MITTANILLAAAVICLALMAGLFFAYSNSVMPALRKAPDSHFVQTMQQINRTIQNPLFFVVFFGALLLLPASAYMFYGTARFKWLLAATIIYVLGVFAVTALGNIPLNERLDKFNTATAGTADFSMVRKNFEHRWNQLNNIRTLFSVWALLLAVISFLVAEKDERH